MSHNIYLSICSSKLILALTVLIILSSSLCTLYAVSGSYQCNSTGVANTTYSDNKNYCVCNNCAAGFSLDTYKISCCSNSFTSYCLTCVNSPTGQCSQCDVRFGLSNGVCNQCNYFLPGC